MKIHFKLACWCFIYLFIDLFIYLFILLTFLLLIWSFSLKIWFNLVYFAFLGSSPPPPLTSMLMKFAIHILTGSLCFSLQCSLIMAGGGGPA